MKLCHWALFSRIICIQLIIWGKFFFFLVYFFVFVHYYYYFVLVFTEGILVLTFIMFLSSFLPFGSLEALQLPFLARVSGFVCFLDDNFGVLYLSSLHLRNAHCRGDVFLFTQINLLGLNCEN